MWSRGRTSPSATPRAAAIAHEAVAIARQPGTDATVRALAASQTLTRTRIAGSRRRRRSSSARATAAADMPPTVLPARGDLARQRVEEQRHRPFELIDRRVLHARDA